MLSNTHSSAGRIWLQIARHLHHLTPSLESISSYSAFASKGNDDTLYFSKKKIKNKMTSSHIH